MLLDPADRGFVQHDNMSIAFIPKAQHYDRDESYVRRWLPELHGHPAGSIHTGGRID